MAQEDKFIVPQRKPAVGKSTVVSVRLPDTMLAKLEDVASKTGRSRNELVQMCIDYALARLEITGRIKNQAVALGMKATAWFSFRDTNTVKRGANSISCHNPITFPSFSCASRLVLIKGVGHRYPVVVLGCGMTKQSCQRCGASTALGNEQAGVGMAQAVDR